MEKVFIGDFSIFVSSISFVWLQNQFDEIIIEFYDGGSENSGGGISWDTIQDISIARDSLNQVVLTVHYTYNNVSQTSTTTGLYETILENLYDVNGIIPCFFDDDEFMGFGKVTTTGTDAEDIMNSLQSSPNVFDTTTNFIIFYTLNSPKNQVTKSLTHVGTEKVSYNTPITHKNLTLNMKLTASDRKFNYVYLSVLNRYYYVVDMVLTNDYAQLQLQEDVLMSFSGLIRSQTAFVTRSESNGNLDMFDNLVVFDVEKSITVTTVTLNLTDFFNYDMYTMVTINGTT